MSILSLSIKDLWIFSLPFVLLLVGITFLGVYIKSKGGKSILLTYWTDLFKIIFYSLIVWGTLYIDTSGETIAIQLQNKLSLGEYLLVVVSSLEIISSIISIFGIISNQKIENSILSHERRISELEKRVMHLEISKMKSKDN